MGGGVHEEHGGAAITIAASAWMQPAFLACQAFLGRCRREGWMDGKRDGGKDSRFPASETQGFPRLPPGRATRRWWWKRRRRRWGEETLPP